jgi:V/A-type H+-transporting ATPase subunit E
MSDKLRLLTDKIYREGVEKAQSEAERILAAAKSEAEQLRSEAQAERNRTLHAAEAQAAAMKRQVGAEITLAARKASGQLKQDLRRLLAEDVLQAPLQKGLTDQGVLTEVLIACVSALQQQGDGSWEIQLPAEQRKLIEDAITGGKHEALGEGLTLRDAEGLSYGFAVRPEGEQYTLAFDDKAFAAFLGRFLRIETRELLGTDFADQSTAPTT